MKPSARFDWLKSVTTDAEIQHSAVRVAAYLACSHNHTSGQLNPSVVTITDNTTLSKRAVIYAIKQLIDNGYLDRESGGDGRGNRSNYRLIKGANSASLNKGNNAKTDIIKGAKNDIKKGADNAPIQSIKGAKNDIERVQNLHLKGAKNDIPPTPPYKENTGKNTGKEHGKVKKAKKQMPERPADIDRDLWAEWMDVRKAKKAVNSPTAITTLLNNLDKCVEAGYSKTMAMEMAINESWKSINPQWIKNKLQRDGNGNGTSTTTPTKTRNDIHREAYANYAATGCVDSRDIREDANPLRSVVDETSRREGTGRTEGHEGVGANVIQLHR